MKIDRLDIVYGKGKQKQKAVYTERTIEEQIMIHSLASAAYYGALNCECSHADVLPVLKSIMQQQVKILSSLGVRIENHIN